MAQAKRGEIDAIVVGGGDGSVRTVAGVLADTGVPLGVLPLGTLNHFAKDLGIPLKVEQAAAAIAAGHTRNVDIAEVNGKTFINNSSIGIYPYMQLNINTADIIPARFVKEMTVKRGGELVFQMQSTFSISTNPNFRFTFGRGADNSLDVVVKDTDGAVFTAQSEPSGS